MQWFSSFRVHQKHLEGLSAQPWMDLLPEFWIQKTQCGAGELQFQPIPGAAAAGGGESLYENHCVNVLILPLGFGNFLFVLDSPCFILNANKQGNSHLI